MFPGISLIIFSEPFLTTPIFICHVVVISISRSLYLESLSGNLGGGIFIRRYSHINESTFLIPTIVDDKVRVVCRNLSVHMNRHVLKNGDIILLFHHFWFVFVPLVYCVHVVYFTHLPMYIGCHIVVPVYVFCFLVLGSPRQHGRQFPDICCKCGIVDLCHP